MDKTINEAIKNNTNKKYEWIINAILSVSIILCVGIVFYINIYKYNSYMNSDIGTEALLGREISITKQWIPVNWVKSSETRILSMPHIAAILYGLNKDMVLSAGIACCIVTLLITASVIFFVKSYDFSLSQKLAIILLCFVLPANEAMYELVYIRACYYFLCVIALFITLGMLARIYNRNTKKGIKFIFILIVTYSVSFVLGLQGMRGILNVYGPLVALVLAICLIRLRKMTKVDKLFVIHIICLFMVSFLGSLFPISVGQSFSRNIRKGVEKLITVVWDDFCIAIGLKSEYAPFRVCIIIMFALSIISLGLVVIKILKNRNEVNIVDWTYLVLWLSPVMTAVFLAFTTIESADRYFNIFAYTMALAPIYIIKSINKNAVEYAMYALVLIVSIFSLLNFFKPQLCGPSVSIASDEEAMLEYLETKGIHRGYTNFDYANRLTVIYNGAVNLAPIDNMQKMNMLKWDSCKNWYPPNVSEEEATAYIATRDVDALETFVSDKEENILDKTVIGRFTIYILDKNYAVLE